MWGTGEWVTIDYATVWVHAYTTHLNGDNIACVVMMFTNPNLFAQLVDALRRVTQSQTTCLFSGLAVQDPLVQALPNVISPVIG